MAVVGVTEYFKQRQGKFNLSFYPSDEVDRYFRVQTDANTDDAIVVFEYLANTAGIPIGAPYPGSNILTVRSIVPKQVAGTPFWWDVQVHYEDAPLKPTQDPNPLNREARIKLKSVRYQKAIIKDVNGNLMCNSANDPYPPYMADASRWTITIEKNYPYNAVPGWALTCQDGVNQDDWSITQFNGLTVPQGNAKISEVDLTDILSENVNGIPVLYRTLTLGIDVTADPNGFQLVTQDAGFRAVNVIGSQNYYFPIGPSVPTGQLYYIQVMDQFGHPVYPTEPQPLDGASAQLSQSQIAAGNFIYNTFTIYQQFDFSQIPVS